MFIQFFKRHSMALYKTDSVLIEIHECMEPVCSELI